MLIFGHELINMQKFFHYQDGDFAKDSINCFKFDEENIKKAKKENIEFAIFVQNEDELILSNALEAKYALIEDKNLAKIASKLAEFYMFDMKILFLVDEIKNLNQYYKLKIDGVCLKTYIT
ncbi:hypothetical protein IY974_03720 [Campylobacter volucris]|uniref:hypothetical protein n=1 Tax=Campylobacter volucris TaxID=1031542 RepID=UPI00189E2B4C|nr:hypothetical protein [Campylobacter volucris]MBF7045669.1 hypothetical protein [Campylobacter volucris]